MTAECHLFVNRSKNVAVVQAALVLHIDCDQVTTMPMSDSPQFEITLLHVLPDAVVRVGISKHLQTAPTSIANFVGVWLSRAGP